MPLRIFKPTLSNLITSSSSVRVRVLLTTVPAPKAGCETRSPLAKRCTGGGAGGGLARPFLERPLLALRRGGPRPPPPGGPGHHRRVPRRERGREPGRGAA